MKVNVVVYSDDSKKKVFDFLKNGKIHFKESQTRRGNQVAYLFEFKVNEKYAEIFENHLVVNRIRYDVILDDEAAREQKNMYISRKQVRRSNTWKKGRRAKCIATFRCINDNNTLCDESRKEDANAKNRSDVKKFYKRQANKYVRRKAKAALLADALNVPSTKGGDYKKSYDLDAYIL